MMERCSDEIHQLEIRMDRKAKETQEIERDHKM